MTNNKKILIGTTSFSSISKLPLNILKKTEYGLIRASKRKFNYDELSEILPNCIGIIAGTEFYDKKLLSIASNLRAISRIGIGLDNIDLNYAKERNIKILTTKTNLSSSVAELTVSLILSFYKRLNENHNNVINGSFSKVPGRMLNGKRVGIIGLGNIGKETVKILKSFSCNFSAFDNNYDEIFLKKNNVEKSSLINIFENSDIICIHLSYSKDLYHMINYNLIKKTKKNPLIVNTSRGQLINEKDLIKCLDEKCLSGVALDVFETEPYSGPLCNRNDVLLTPHIGSYSKEVREKMEVESVENLLNNI